MSLKCINIDFSNFNIQIVENVTQTQSTHWLNDQEEHGRQTDRRVLGEDLDLPECWVCVGMSCGWECSVEGCKCRGIKTWGEVRWERGSDVVAGTVGLEAPHRGLIMHTRWYGGVGHGHVGSHPRCTQTTLTFQSYTPRRKQTALTISVLHP